jgi:hypothetical protein
MFLVITFVTEYVSAYLANASCICPHFCVAKFEKIVGFKYFNFEFWKI